MDFAAFTSSLWLCLDTIRPQHLFLEMGKEYLADYILDARKRWKYVTFYNATYYHKQENKCYIIHATNDHKRRRYPELEDRDEADAIQWICTKHPYQCIGDLCMGKGLVGKHAYLAGKRFVGTELNPKRLACLVDFIRMEEQKKATNPR